MLVTRPTIVVLALALAASCASCCLTIDTGSRADAGADAGLDAGSNGGSDAGGLAEDGGCPPEQQCLGYCTCTPIVCGCGAGETICFTETDAGCDIPLGCTDLDDDSNCGACGNVCGTGTHCASPDGVSVRCAAEDGGPITGTLWISGIGALNSQGVPQAGAVPFDDTCPYPSTQDFIYVGPAVIDGEGDLWSQDASGALYVWTPAQLRESCSSQSPSKTLSLPALTSLAFDAQGNLWGAVYPATAVIGYRSADLQTSGSPLPTWTLIGDCSSLDSLCSPEAIAFDADGYLWVGGTLGLQAFSPSSRTGGGHLDDFHITTSCTVSGYRDAGQDRPPCAWDFMNLAFDASGTVWVSSQLVPYSATPSSNHLIAYSRAQLENARNDDLPQPVRDFIFSGLPNTPVAGAFDANGDLWLEGFTDAGAGLFRMPQDELALDGGSDQTVADPNVSILVPSIGFSLAFSPIPPGLPIQP